MRNLKRTLSLALSAVMLMGMMVIGAGAASTDFTDASDIKNVEAVDVMVALGVLEGGDNGAFQPDSILTREQAAKIICYMLLGEESAEKLSTNSAVFSDVAADRWSAPYISYCVNMGILAGDGNGNFFPEGQLTGAAFAKMLLVALGYDASIEKYVGNDWMINVASDAIEAGISPAGVVLSDNLSRQNAAQMAFQTLTASMVKYDNKGADINFGGGNSVNIGASSASAVSNNSGNHYDKRPGITADAVMQFCEKYFPDLTKGTGDPDAFGRPADYKWKLGSKDVYNASKEATVVFNAGTTVDDVAKTLKGYKVNDNAATPALKNVTDKNFTSAAIKAANGATATSIVVANGTGDSFNNEISKLTGNGKLVEIFADSNKVITNVIEVTYTVGEVTKVSTNKDGNVTYTISNNGTGIDYANDEENDDTISIDGTIAQGDMVTFVKIGTVSYVYPTTVVTGAQSAFNGSKGTITVDGTVYTVGTAVKDDISTGLVALGDFSNSSTAANYYIDQYGFVVATSSTASASTDYAYVIDVNGKLSTTIDGSTPTVEVRVVLADGTVGVYTVAVEKLKAGDSRLGPADNDSMTLDAGDYVVKGTKIIVYNAVDTNGATAGNEVTAGDTGVTGLADYMKGMTFGYTLKDTTITLEVLTALPATSTATANDTVYTASLGNVVKKDVTTYTVNADKKVLADKNTKFVVYDADAKTAAVYTGAANLPSAVDKLNSNSGGTGYAVLKTGTTADLGTASVIFVLTADGIGASATNEYVYIDATKFDVTLVNDETKYTYTVTYPDGSTKTLTSDTKIGTGVANDSGLYVINEDGTIGNSLRTVSTDANLSSSNAYGYGLMTVEGTLLGIDNGYYNITDDTQIVYIDDNLSEINGNTGFVVLVEKDGNATSNVAAIFVTTA